MSRARTRLHVIIHEDCDGKRREREVDKPTKRKSLFAHRQRIDDGRHRVLHRRTQEQGALP